MSNPNWLCAERLRRFCASSSGQVQLLALLCGLSLVAVTMWRTDAAREAALTSNQVVAENLARSLSDNAAAKLLAADILAGELADRVERDGTSPGATARLREVMQWRVDTVPGIRALVVQRADGAVLAQSGGGAPDAGPADHDALLQHLGRGDRGAFLGRPLQDPSTGRWSVSLSRRIASADGSPDASPGGSFAGMASVTLELGGFYSDYDLGPHGAIMLVREDGTIIVRVPTMASRVGVSIADGPFFRAYQAHPTKGSAEAVSAFDGRYRRESYDKVAGFPLVVFVAHTRDDALAAWREQAVAEIGIAVTSAVLLGLLGWRLAKQIRIADQAGAAVRASEEQFRALYTRTPLPLHSLDRDGRIEHVSEAWLEALGYDRGQVLGRKLTDFMAEPSAQQAAGTDWPELLRTGALTDGSYQVFTASGGSLEVLASARVERDGAGQFLRVLGGLTNVTERRQAEEALRQAQKIEAVGQLTAGVAHDFNNLLAVVMGNLGLLRKRLPDDAKAVRYLEHALQAVQRGAGLTHRLLAFARKQHLRPEAVDVPALVRGMHDLLHRSVGPEIQIQTRFPDAMAHAHVDANQLELTLLNLVVNARDAMPAGGTITISACEVTVPGDAATPAAGHYVRLSVRDTGEGMDEATLSRAMEPFFTTKGVGKGTGLGLSMAQGLAAQSGGRLVLRSAVGRGTTAELWLPAREAPVEHAVTAETSAAPVGQGSRRLTIMVVDDDALVLANTSAMLEDLGHDVMQAASGPAALLQLAGCGRLDLLITDHAMPAMTGVQLLVAVQEARPGLPVLLVSGYADLPAEADRYARLDKPFSQAALAAAVDALATMDAEETAPAAWSRQPESCAL